MLEHKEGCEATSRSFFDLGLILRIIAKFCPSCGISLQEERREEQRRDSDQTIRGCRNYMGFNRRSK